MELSAYICRVSTREQELGYSLDAQEQLLKEYCSKHDLKPDIVHVFSETASKMDQRKKFNAFLEEVMKKGISHIIVEKTDRLTRGGLKEAVRIYEWLEENADRRLHSVKENIVLHKNSKSQEKFMFDMRIVLAKNTTDNLREEVMKAQQVMVNRGILPTAPPPGYITVGPDGQRRHIPDPDTRQIAAKMFEYYADTGISVIRLGDKMFEEGLRNRHGNKIVTSRIHKLLQDPFYAGKLRWNDKVYDGIHEAIISDELFERVQRRLKRKTVTLFRKREHLFREITICGGCEGLVSWERHTRGQTYGYCKKYRPCDSRTVCNEGEIEKQIVQWLTVLEIKNKRIAEWLRKALRDSHHDAISYRDSSLAELQKQLDQVNRRLDHLYDDKLDGSIEKDMYDRKFVQFSEEKKNIVKRIERQSDSDLAYLDTASLIFDLSQAAVEIYLKGNPEQKRQIFSHVFEKLVIRGNVLEATYTKPYWLISQAVEQTNRTKSVKLDEIPKFIFEHQEIGSEKQKDQPVGVGHPTWLPGKDSNLRSPHPE
jgi:site-specific DNA recombinase